ncbi:MULTISPECIES: hypothetical protein [unclassified Pseudofrankia]|nr:MULTISPECIES: hypothetical protein [unclassified Pseudofrankia]MDT3444532.1 hypothetical protein [Pseudofrankia sp. BMG5.37]
MDLRALPVDAFGPVSESVRRLAASTIAADQAMLPAAPAAMS